MTKKHFIRAAEIVSGFVDPYHAGSMSVATGVANAFVRLFREFNPRFDTDRFLVACGLQDAPIQAGKGKHS